MFIYTDAYKEAAWSAEAVVGWGVDGLCHAYGEYPLLDCLRPEGHEGNHGDMHSSDLSIGHAGAG
jgi:hypothetical protein